MVAARLVTKIMVEGNDPVHFGAGEVQRLSDERHAGRADAAKFFEETVKNWEHRAFKPGMFGDDFFCPLGVPGANLGHGFHVHFLVTTYDPLSALDQPWNPLGP